MNNTDIQVLGRHIATFAGRAPSVHNTQPWQFSLDGRLLHVYANPARRLLVSDPEGREMILSCGAAIRFAELVAAQFVDRLDVQYFPNRVRPLHLATIDLRGTVSRPVEPFTGVEQTISRRWSDRRPFGAPDREQLRTRLSQLDEDHGHCSVALAGPDTVALIASMGAQHEAANRYDAAYRHEMRWWAANRAYADGISPQQRPADPAAAPATGSHFPAGTLRTAPVDDGAGLALISASGDEPLDWVHSGRLLADILLSATTAGLHSCTLTQFLEPVAGQPGGPRLREAGPAAIQAAVRIGTPTGPDPAARTRRLSVDSIFEIW